MSDDFEASEKNWLSREVSERSLARLMTASTAVFHRLRVAERLILKQDPLAQSEDLGDRAKQLVEEENESRQKNIKDFELEAKHDSKKAWYEPYDMSPGVITDGAKWYGQLKAQTGEFQYMSICISKLVKDLYEISVNKELAQERMKRAAAGGKFSTLISDMVKGETYRLRAIGKKQVANNSMDSVIDKAGGRTETGENKLVEWVNVLAPDIDDLYAATGTGQ